MDYANITDVVYCFYCFYYHFALKTQNIRIKSKKKNEAREPKEVNKACV